MRLAWVVVAWMVVAGAGVARAEPAPAPDAMVRYQQEAVGVRHLVYPLRDGTIADEHGQIRYDGQWDAFRGVDHHPIDGADFFRIVGRDDLRTSYQRWSAVKRALGAGAWVLVVAGATAVMIGAMSGRDQPAGTASSSDRSVQLTGLGLISSGIISMVVSHFINPAPIGADAADRLAHDYDQSLRAGLGLTDRAAAAER